MRELGFVGVLVDNRSPGGKFYDGAEYEGWWAAVEEVGVPVYLHPSWVGEEEMAGRYEGGFWGGGGEESGVERVGVAL